LRRTNFRSNLHFVLFFPLKKISEITQIHQEFPLQFYALTLGFISGGCSPVAHHGMGTVVEICKGKVVDLPLVGFKAIPSDKNDRTVFSKSV